MSPQDAFHKTVHGAPGGCEALAVRLGMSPAVLRNKANPNANFNKPTMDDIDRVMAVTQDYSTLDALAANHGRVCVELEEGASASDVAVVEIITKMWSTNGDVGAAVNKALEDGRIDQREIAAIEERAMCHVRAVQQMVARLKGMAQK